MATDVATTHSEGTAHQKLLDNRHNQIRNLSLQNDQKLKLSFPILAGESPTPRYTSYSYITFICSTVGLVSAVGRPSRPSSEPLSGPLTFSASENYFRITLSNVFMASPQDLCIEAEILS